MLRFAIRNLLSRPIRSLLSLLGIAVAIAGMVGLFSVAEGIDATATLAFNRIPGLVCMQHGASIPLFSRLPLAWRDEISALPGVNAVSAEVWTLANVINGRTIVSRPRLLFGADIDAHQKLKFSVYGSAVIEGRYLDLSDKGTSHAVVSRQIAEEFQLQLGSRMTVNDVELEVVGIYHCGTLFLDIAIVVDADLVRRISLIDARGCCSFYVEPTGEISNAELANHIRKVFRGRLPLSSPPASVDVELLGGMPTFANAGAAPEVTSNNPIVRIAWQTDAAIKSLRPEGSASKAESSIAIPELLPQSASLGVPTNAVELPETCPIDVRSADDWVEQFSKFSRDIDVFLGVMASIGVAVAVLSIVNTMLMSVTERIIEFGILKANGWSRRDVIKLITFESATLGLGGGLLGASLGWLLTLGINCRWPSHVQLIAGPELLGFGLILATVLGILGGIYPAVWATRLMPMDAIRRG